MDALFSLRNVPRAYGTLAGTAFRNNKSTGLRPQQSRALESGALSAQSTLANNRPVTNSLSQPVFTRSVDEEYAAQEESGTTSSNDVEEQVEDVRYTVPFGETGQGYVSHANELNSRLRVFAFESQHAAAHRQLLLRNGEPNTNTDIRIRTAVDTNGNVIAIGGETETEADFNGDGSKEVLRELAYISDVRRLFISGGNLAMGMDKRPMPAIRHTGTIASAYRALQNRASIRNLMAGKESIGTVLRRYSKNELNKVIDAFEPIEKTLSNLQATLETLTSDSALTAVKAESDSESASVEVASRSAQPGEYSVDVRQLASAHTVESSLLFDPEHADEEADLGLSGSFYINGIAIEIEATDSPTDIVNKINYGEDLNHNGILDTGSDYYDEEDADSDGVLDGGTSAHNVFASLVDGRLRLAMNTAGPTEIDAYDPDGILESLGFMSQASGQALSFARVVTPAASATVAVDDKEDSYSTNTIEDAIDGLRLTLSSLTETPANITVERDAEGLADELENLVEDFNAAIRELNEALNPETGILYREDAVARVRIEMRRNTVDEIAGQPDKYQTGGDVGLENSPGNRISFTSMQLDAALQNLKQTLTGSGGNYTPMQKQTGMPSVYNSLGLIGITGEDDDTLSLDREALLDAVEDNLDAVRTLFNKEDGYIPRLYQTVSNAIRDGSGNLSLAKMTLQAMAQTDLQDALGESLQNLQTASITNSLTSMLAGSQIA